MPNSFRFEFKNVSGREILFLSGVIDENASFKSIPLPKSAPLSIDLAGIQHLNSLGLRSWVLWMKSIVHPSGVFFLRCPSPVIDQINILDGFLPMHATVESLQIPFLCSDCNTTSYYLAERGHDFQEATADTASKIAIPMHIPCRSCGNDVEADIIPSKYFRFLDRRARRR